MYNKTIVQKKLYSYAKPPTESPVCSTNLLPTCSWKVIRLMPVARTVDKPARCHPGVATSRTSVGDYVRLRQSHLPGVTWLFYRHYTIVPGLFYVRLGPPYGAFGCTWRFKIRQEHRTVNLIGIVSHRWRAASLHDTFQRV